MRLLGCVLVSVLIAGSVTQVSAQTDPCLYRTVPVNVYAEQGEAFTHFPASDFQASIGDKPVGVTSAAIGNGPLHIVILIDVSRSMNEGGNLKRGLEFAQDLISLASNEDSLALLTFSNQVEDTLVFGVSRTALVAEIHKLQDTDWRHVKGTKATALIDALANAMTLIKTPSVGDAICLVSDGGENASQSNWFKFKARLELSGVRTYTYLPTWQSSSPIKAAENFGASELRGLAALSGGDVLQFGPGILKGVSSSTSAFGGFGGYSQEIMRDAHVFHTEIFRFEQLTLRLPEPLAKPVRWNLEVVDDLGRRNRHVHVFYPQRLAPCTSGDGH
jgi:hypothetical protein